jgi:hypothetical protein
MKLQGFFPCQNYLFNYFSLCEKFTTRISTNRTTRTVSWRELAAGKPGEQITVISTALMK